MTTRLLTVDGHARYIDKRDGWELDLRIETPGRWVRGGLFWGMPPGSHIGFWRTRLGDFHGWNFRVGKRYSGPCLTALVHTAPGNHCHRCRDCGGQHAIDCEFR